MDRNLRAKLTHIARTTKFNASRAGVANRCLRDVYVGMVSLSRDGLSLQESQEAISEAAEYSKRQVSTAISWLRKHGFIWTKHNFYQCNGEAKQTVSTTIFRKLAAVVEALKLNKYTVFAENASPLLKSKPAIMHQTLIDPSTGELLHESTREGWYRPTEKEVLRRGAL